MKFTDKVEKFMYGRNGIDLCNKVIIGLYVVFMILGVVIQNLIADYIFVGIALLLAILFIFRSMSKNLGKRRKENEIFYKIRDKIRKTTKLNKSKWRDRKTHVYKKCPKCKAVLRLKREKGKHSCSCPHCGAGIEVKIH